MQFHGAIMKYNGSPFGIVHVTSPIPRNVRKMDYVVSLVSKPLGNIPIVFATRNRTDGAFSFYGRDDHLQYLSGCSASDIPWKMYKITEG